MPALAAFGVAPAWAQSGGYAAEIVAIDQVRRQVTFKASMGQQTMRSKAGVALEAFKAGDKVLITFGQERKESVITRMEVVKS